jgi:hypothetical protein
MHCNNLLVPEHFCVGEDISTEDAAYKLTDRVLKFIKQVCI